MHLSCRHRLQQHNQRVQKQVCIHDHLILRACATFRPHPKDCRWTTRAEPDRASNAADSEPPKSPAKPTSLPVDTRREYTTWPAVRTPPPRRVFIGLLTGAGIVLGGNLGGITGYLLGLDDGKTAAQLQLDAVIPVLGFKRCVSPEGFQFVYPGNWLGDQTIYRRRIEASESSLGLNLPDLGDAERVARRRREAYIEPAVAFGPMGGGGEDNISVIAGPSPGLRLRNLGSPEEVGQKLLEKQLAVAGSGKVGQIVSAKESNVEGIDYYTLEYQLQKAGGPRPWERHFIAVLCARNEKLYTMTAQCAETRWSALEAGFEKAADSFRVADVPNRLI